MPRIWGISSAWLEVRIFNMRDQLSTEKFRHMMASSFKDTGRHFRQLMQTELGAVYAPPKRWIGSAVKSYRMSNSGMSCTIPISGVRGVAGAQYKASGDRGRKKKGAKPNIYAKILQAGKSKLPAKMTHQGGNPPFRMNGLVFTRKTNKPYPVARVAGLAVPQMPVSNRARGRVEKSIVRYLSKRIDYHFGRLM